MLQGVFVGLLVGWILSLFGFVGVFNSGMMELFQIQTSTSSYYLIFAFLGIITWLTYNVKSK